VDQRLKILSLEFTPKWSWGLVIKELLKTMPDFQFERVFDLESANRMNSDAILCQQVSLLQDIAEKEKTACRLGGNRSFDAPEAGRVEQYMQNLSKCFAVVATNRKLYEIAKLANANSYLIPNGLDIIKWRPPSSPVLKKNRRPCTYKVGHEPENSEPEFVAGFCGNISKEKYASYKGHDLFMAACRQTNIIPKLALYGKKQIPHDQMIKKFYYRVDGIVHPTRGEGCSNTLMEACACGLPIITTRQAGFHGELMRDGEDCLFCERTAESIAECLCEIRRNTELRKRLSENARLFALEHHDVTKIAEQYRRIFAGMVHNNKDKSNGIGNIL